jgi:Na+/proline symporter
VYAKFWRRLGVATDIEFYEIRYSGRPAAFLRGFRAAYIGIFFNVIIMATVTLALVKYANVLFGTSPLVIVVVAGVVTVIFSAAGGLMGILFTDLMLFVVSMSGAIMAAYFAVNLPEVGGLASLIDNPDLVAKRAFLPDLSDPNQYVPLLLVPLLIQWWSAWYPGSEPGGGGYVAQRMLSAKDERHAALALDTGRIGLSCCVSGPGKH